MFCACTLAPWSNKIWIQVSRAHQAATCNADCWIALAWLGSIPSTSRNLVTRSASPFWQAINRISHSGRCCLAVAISVGLDARRRRRKRRKMACMHRLRELLKCAWARIILLLAIFCHLICITWHYYCMFRMHPNRVATSWISNGWVTHVSCVRKRPTLAQWVILHR